MNQTELTKTVFESEADEMRTKRGREVGRGARKAGMSGDGASYGSMGEREGTSGVDVGDGEFGRVGEDGTIGRRGSIESQFPLRARFALNEGTRSG